MAGAGAASWQKDTFLDDFLSDTNQFNVDLDDSASGGYSDLDFLSAADISLSSYLSGETCEDVSSRKSNTTTTRRDRAERLSLSPTSEDVDAIQSQSHRSIIVVTRPAPNSNKGNSHSKSAMAARENRQKKKQYVSNLELSVQNLTEENELLRKQDAEQKRQILKYQEEVRYLKNVIINESRLSALLQNIQNTSGVKLSSSLLAAAETNENLSAGADIPATKRKRKLEAGRKDTCGFQVTTKDQPSCTERFRIISPTDVSAQNPAVHPPHRFSGNGDSFVETIDLTGSPEETSNAKENMQTDSHDENGDTNHAGGICLHVLGDSVSIELCSSCNESAVRSFSTDHAYSRTSPCT